MKYYSKLLNCFKMLVDGFLQLLYPEGISCISCKALIEISNKYHLCHQCMKNIQFIEAGSWMEGIVQNSGKPVKIYSVTSYNTTARRIISRYKYHNETHIAKILASAIIDTLKKENVYFDGIVAVPLYDKRKNKRGFNQSDLMADYISKECNVYHFKDNLVRMKNTKAMHLLSKGLRIKNVSDAFVVKKPEEFKNRHILIVDDIITTGATINACCRALSKTKAPLITAITFARRGKEEKKWI